MKYNFQEGFIMQYKTVTIEHSRKMKKDAAQELNSEYEQIINREAADGWKLLGIHPIEIKRVIGCKQMLLCGFLLGRHNFYQADVFIFFRD